MLHGYSSQRRTIGSFSATAAGTNIHYKSRIKYYRIACFYCVKSLTGAVAACPEGFESVSGVSNCYKAGTSALSWFDAAHGCHSSNPYSHLLVMYYAYEQPAFSDWWTTIAGHHNYYNHRSRVGILLIYFFLIHEFLRMLKYHRLFSYN